MFFPVHFQSHSESQIQSDVPLMVVPEIGTVSASQLTRSAGVFLLGFYELGSRLQYLAARP